MRQRRVHEHSSASFHTWNPCAQTQSKTKKDSITSILKTPSRPCSSKVVATTMPNTADHFVYTSWNREKDTRPNWQFICRELASGVKSRKHDFHFGTLSISLLLFLQKGSSYTASQSETFPSSLDVHPSPTLRTLHHGGRQLFLLLGEF